MRRNSVRVLLGIGLLVLFACHVAGWISLPFLPLVESMFYDARVRALAPHTIDDRIVVIDIDEKSLREKDRGGEGHWPWRRDRLAQLVTDLFDRYGVSLVAMDLILSERDASPEIDILENLKQHELKAVPEFAVALEHLKSGLTFDQLLGKSMQGGPVVLGYAFHNDTPATNTRLPQGYAPDSMSLSKLRSQSYPGYSGLLPELQENAAGAGHLNHVRDSDGVTRRVPLLIEYNGRYYPSLALAVVQTLTGVTSLGFVTSPRGDDVVQAERVTVGPIVVPMDDALNVLVPFRGAAHSFSYVSATDVLHGRVPVEQLKNRIVLVGTSAAGLSDLATTPMGVSFPGVEIHANLITGMLDGRIVQPAAYVEMGSVIVLGLIMVFGGIWLKPQYTMLTLLLSLAGLVAFSMSMQFTQQLMLPLAAPLLCLVSVFIFQMSYGYFVESRGKRQMSQLFANYVPPEIVERMAENPDAFSMSPVERELTVLFADVRGFTSISEQLSPTELAELLNAFLTAMSEIIRERHHGTLDKYIGDAVMAFWGAPIPDAHHADDAVLAALDMQREVRRLNQEFIAKGWPALKIGIGLNSGLMRVGDMGSKVRRAYTVMGDAVNLGARLEGLTKIYGVDILISGYTRSLLQGWICREVDRVRVKGKHQLISIYEPLGRVDDVPGAVLEELHFWDQVLMAYRSQQWVTARDLIAHLIQEHPTSGLYALYAQRIEHFESQSPTLDWDGATNFEIK